MTLVLILVAASSWSPIVRLPSGRRCGAPFACEPAETPYDSLRSAASDPDSPFALKTALARFRDSYTKGYKQTRSYFSTEGNDDAAGEPLRPTDLAGAAVLTVVFTESVFLGGATAAAWLAGSSTSFLGSAPQARLAVAASAAITFRGRTRPVRLLSEMAIIPLFMQMVRKRNVEDRLTFCKERSTQMVAVLATLILTIRAFNSGWLAGTTEPAALILASKIAGLWTQTGGQLLRALPCYDAVGCWMTAAAIRGWSAASSFGHDVAALQVPRWLALPAGLIAPLAELERLFVPFFKFIAAALLAFVDEALKPGLRRLGWLTMQTLG